MDNRAATVLLIVGVSFVFWLHNTDRLAPIVDIVKSGGAKSPQPTGSGAPIPSFSFGDYFSNYQLPFVGSVNK